MPMPKILAIDDKQDNLITITAVLKALIPDCQVITAQSGPEGIEMAKAESPDTILLDIRMPKMDGYEVCERLKNDERTKHIPVIMLTAINNEPKDLVKGLSAGADAYLAKPIDESVLIAQVNTALRIKAAEDQLRNQKELLEEMVLARTVELTRVNERLEQEIKEHRRAEQEKMRVESQLRQALKMEAIGTLTGGIAHDFNNIIGIIIGNAELAFDDIPDWNPARHNLEKIKTASLRAKDVVRQLLSFSRKTELNRKPIKIGPIVDESMKLLRASIPASIEMRTNILNDTGTIQADPTQIHQVVINLCTNAAHAMEEEGGIMEISLAEIQLGEMDAPGDGKINPGSYVQLTVKDTGQGISEDVTNRIFDPYFTTKEVGKGSGMGLAVVHGIVQSHNGSIMVKSIPGKGTAFKLFFPITLTEEVQEPETREEMPTGNEQILFVDDEEAMVELNRQRLERLGYTVMGETDPLKALDHFRSHPESFDLMITDMTMPHMTGDKLVQEILKIRPDLPIILCTGYSEKISEESAKEIGIRKYIEKPIERETLARTVREVLDGW